jgi:signal transduction histidine kinase/ActR/RegA family two-component response regulator
MVHADDQERLKLTLGRAFQDGSDFEIEYRIHRRDGAERILHVHGRLFTDAAGRPLRSLGTMQDVTAVRRQEQTIREQQQALVHSEALAAIGSLAASVAHEVNNPLAYVLLNLEDAISAMAPEHYRVRPRVQEALDGVRRVAAIVKTLKGLSGAHAPESGPVDAVQSVEAALSMAWNAIQHRARIVKDFAPVPRVLGDDVRLAQVFLNLLVNAGAAIEQGTVAENEIRLVVRPQGDEVLVEIRDTGCGIAPENLGRIFEPFFSTKSRAKGTGLGLPVSRKIVEELGGRLEVSSVPGRGTTFIVHLRAVAGPPVEATPTPPVTAPAVDEDVVEARVLVADDERLIRRAIARALPRCVIVEAESGEQARQILAHDRDFDLILCDMMMPRMSGMELHEWLSGIDASMARRMVFITGGAFTAPARAFLERGDVRRLEKPFDGASLRKLVREAHGGTSLAVSP